MFWGDLFAPTKVTHYELTMCKVFCWGSLSHHLTAANLTLDIQTPPEKERFQKIAEAPSGSELRIQAQKNHLVDEQNLCHYLAWNKDQKRLIPSKSKPLTVTETMDLLTKIQECVSHQEATLRFHSLKKMQEDTSKAIPFIWMVSHRFPELWHLLKKLAFHSSLQLAQISLKPAGLPSQEVFGCLGLDLSFFY